MNINYITYTSGFNGENQLIKSKDDHLTHISYPLKLTSFKYKQNLKKPIQISLSHIFWHDGHVWKLNGYKAKHLDSVFNAIQSSSLVRSCEMRVAFLNENCDIIISSISSTKKLHLQQIKCEINDEKEGPIEIKDIALEDNCLLCLSKDGKLFSGGVEIALQGVKIDQIAVGKEHCLALTTDGKVLSWGSGMKGQLGNGEIGCVDNPELVSSLDGLQIVQICCGGWHSACVSAAGDVYVWGWNDVGQLGFPSRALKTGGVKWDHIAPPHPAWGSSQGDSHVPAKPEAPNRDEMTKKFSNMINLDRCSELINVQASPRLLDFWAVDYSLRKVVCGDRHTVFLMDNGTAWTSGWNMYGQLGLGSTASVDEPHIVNLEEVYDVFAGAWNSVFVVVSPTEN